MTHNPTRAALLCALCVLSTPTWAVEPESAQAACADVRAAATAAQTRSLQSAIPKNPSGTFDNATNKCLEYVARFNIPQVPMLTSYPLLQKVFEQQAVHLLNKQCNEVGGQYDRTVREAMDSINQRAAEYGVSTSSYSGARAYAAPQVASPAAKEEPGLFRRAVNFLGGDE